MIKQIISNYKIIEPIKTSEMKAMGNSASPKETIFHILDDNSQDISVLDIGFGAGTLAELIKSNPTTSHWHIDGIDGWKQTATT